MFKIGDFSRLCLVSVRMLRHYDELGLLRPERVDDFTGYRYYSTHQLARLNRILALKDLGLSLEQIAKVLNEGLTSEQIRGMLKLKQLELRQQLEEGHAKLARVEAWLDQEEVAMSNYSVILKKVEPVLVAEVRDVVPSLDVINPTLNRVFGEVVGYVAQQGETMRGPALTVYYDAEYGNTNMNIGAAIPIGRPLPETARVKIHELPGHETVASVIHNGSFSGLSGAYSAILAWIEANHYRAAGPNREINHEYDPNGDPAKYVTEIQFPVVKEG